MGQTQAHTIPNTTKSETLYFVTELLRTNPSSTSWLRLAPHQLQNPNGNHQPQIPFLKSKSRCIALTLTSIIFFVVGTEEGSTTTVIKASEIRRRKAKEEEMEQR